MVCVCSGQVKALVQVKGDHEQANKAAALDASGSNGRLTAEDGEWWRSPLKRTKMTEAPLQDEEEGREGLLGREG